MCKSVDIHTQHEDTDESDNKLCIANPMQWLIQVTQHDQHRRQVSNGLQRMTRERAFVRLLLQ